VIAYSCCDDFRRLAIRAQRALNGIDFLEVVDADAAVASERQRELRVHFINSPPPRGILPVNIVISGGERITGVKLDQDPRYDGEVLVLHLNTYGDFSTYTLTLVSARDSASPLEGLDPLLSTVAFSFKVECPTDFDCLPQQMCVPAAPAEPEIDYLGKDYSSFRRLILDRMAQLTFDWQERNPADLGVVLVELLAYVGDYLSYQQDATATEAYLGTARRRVSIRRHARLVDYRLYDGCNARVWIQAQTNADNVKLPQGTPVLTRIPGAPPVVANDAVILDQAAAVFETMHPVSLFAAHNRIPFYTWSQGRCCLPKGATRATLKGFFPNLHAGDVLIFEEVLGPQTGTAGDADPAHRHAIRLLETRTTDRAGGSLADPLTGQAVTEIAWAAADALPFPLCISATADAAHDHQVLDDVSFAQGNIVLADHGRTYKHEDLGVVPPSTLTRAPVLAAHRCSDAAPAPVPPRFYPTLAHSPLTQIATIGPGESVDEPPRRQRFGPDAPAAAAFQWQPRDVLPDIDLNDRNGEVWLPEFDLLASDSLAKRFVAETESDGGTWLRFGDGTNGRRPSSGASFSARYRAGNGATGNVGAEALAHLALNEPAIIGVRNPLPAQGGEDPQSIGEVRQKAPVAFRTQERAVTEDNYAAVAQRDPSVLSARGTFRWTGSWHTAFVTVEREGGLAVDTDFAARTRQRLESFRMAGCDLEIDGPRYVPLEIEMMVCVLDGYFRADVERALLDVFSNHTLPDGRRGVFHPDNFTLGQTVFLSPLYAAAQSVPGVASVLVTVFQRRDTPGRAGLDQFQLPMSRLEIARLSNDPDFPERGVFRLTMGGGK
jgi:hypothetical protein